MTARARRAPNFDTSAALLALTEAGFDVSVRLAGEDWALIWIGPGRKPVGCHWKTCVHVQKPGGQHRLICADGPCGDAECRCRECAP